MKILRAKKLTLLAYRNETQSPHWGFGTCRESQISQWPDILFQITLSPVQNFRFELSALWFEVLFDWCKFKQYPGLLECLEAIFSAPFPSSSTLRPQPRRGVCLSVTLPWSYLRRDMLKNGKPPEITVPVAQSSLGSAEKRNCNKVKEMGLKEKAQLSQHLFFWCVLTLCWALPSTVTLHR